MSTTPTRPSRAGSDRTVFILGGGASLGAHQVGALRCLEEQDIEPDVLICSSIGVINGAIYGSGGVPALEEAWESFYSLPKVLYPTWRDNILNGFSLFSIERLASALEEYIDFPKLLESRLDLEFILLNLSRGRGEMWSSQLCQSWEELRGVTRAGYSIPGLFPPVNLRGEYCIDGGFACNIPLEHALDVGATAIYVLAPIASELPYKASFGGMFDYVPRLLDVFWRTIGNMGHLYAHIVDGCFHGVPTTIIEPRTELSGFSIFGLLNSYPEKARRLMDLGYEDTRRALEAGPVSRNHRPAAAALTSA